MRRNFLSMMGRRVLELDLLIDQKRAVVKLGTMYRATLGDLRNMSAAEYRVARGLHAALRYVSSVYGHRCVSRSPVREGE